MGKLKFDRAAARERRHLRVRRKVSGNPERPRLSVHRSSKHIYAQLIDDSTGRSLVMVSSLSPEARQSGAVSKSIQSARIVGEVLAKKAVERGIDKVVFDRGGYLYHGRVKALAEAAREHGLKF
ncbi:MAG: 50S ribosomal protein L18 [Candidatus Abyssubacteria bacterium]